MSLTSASIPTLLQDIRIALDQNKNSTQLSGVSDIDTLSLDDIILSKVVDAVRNVELNAPSHLINESQVFPGMESGGSGVSITWESETGYGAGSIALPSDFLRLVIFKMSDWERPVFMPISESSPEYAMQRSRFRGISGNPQKPVCSIVSRPTGLHLELYSCNGGSAVTCTMASYIPQPVISGSGNARTINLVSRLRPAIVYLAASMVATTIGNNELASALSSLAQELMK